MLPSMGVIGEIGSGKTYLSEYVHRKHPYTTVFSFREMWIRYAREIGRIGSNKTQLSFDRTKFAKEVMDKYGDDFPIRKMEAEINPAKIYIIEGIRQQFAIDKLKAIFDDRIVFVGIHASEQIRRERLEKRVDYREGSFEEREELDRRFDVKELIRYCDFQLHNDSNKKKIFTRDINGLLRILDKK